MERKQTTEVEEERRSRGFRAQGLYPVDTRTTGRLLHPRFAFFCSTASRNRMFIHRVRNVKEYNKNEVNVLASKHIQQYSEVL